MSVVYQNPKALTHTCHEMSCKVMTLWKCQIASAKAGISLKEAVIFPSQNKLMCENGESTSYLCNSHGEQVVNLHSKQDTSLYAGIRTRHTWAVCTGPWVHKLSHLCKSPYACFHHSGNNKDIFFSLSFQVLLRVFLNKMLFLEKKRELQFSNLQLFIKACGNKQQPESQDTQIWGKDKRI